MATSPTKIPLVQTPDRMVNQLQSNIITPLNKLLKNEIVNNNFLNKVSLKIGVNIINHLLGRIQLGWIITDINGVATIYRSAAFNDTTLTLTSSAVVIVNVMVF